MRWLLTCFLYLAGLSYSQARQSLVEGCPLPQYENDSNVKCGYLEVPENRNVPDSRKIKLAYLVFKAINRSVKEDPIVYLQGGPGGATLTQANYWRNSPLRRDRDFILIDQRGTGFSNAVCSDLGDKLLEVLAMDLTPEEEYQELSKAANVCKKELKKEGVDQAGYNTIQNAKDLDDLRKALGYEKWNLFGGSYGSRLALAYMRDFPQHSRSAVVSGLFPPQVNLYEHFVSNLKRSLEMVFDECAKDEDCNQRYPNLKGTYFEVLDGLKVEPVTFSWGGVPFTLNAQDMLLLTHQMLYTRSTYGQIPAYVMAIKNKDEDALQSAVQPLAGRARLINIAMNWSFNAFDEMSFTSQKDFETDLELNKELMPGPAFFRSDPRILENWHSHRAPAYVNQPVKSDIPALVANGAFDPITPPANALATVKYLPNSFYVEFPSEGHSVFSSCYFSMVKEFLDSPEEQPDFSCAERKPKVNWR